MAINKVINHSAKSHGALRNCIEYELRDGKALPEYVEITGPYAEQEINYDAIYRTWLNEKKLWNKDSGRMYAHNIISFHKDEQVTPSEVLEIGKAFVDNFFSDFQNVIAVHLDKEHLHCHIVTNSVSFVDGHKLHQTKRDLEKQKNYTNKLCLAMGLSKTEKGHHFDGTPFDDYEFSAWSKDKFNLILNNIRKSYVADCAIALMKIIPESNDREEFIDRMRDRGWSVRWSDSRKHIVFENEKGKKVRDSNIEKTFPGLEVNKVALTNTFALQKEQRLERKREEQQRIREQQRAFTTLSLFDSFPGFTL